MSFKSISEKLELAKEVFGNEALEEIKKAVRDIILNTPKINYYIQGNGTLVFDVAYEGDIGRDSTLEELKSIGMKADTRTKFYEFIKFLNDNYEENLTGISMKIQRSKILNNSVDIIHNC